MWSCDCLGSLLIALFFLCLGGWMAWSLWSACDDSGLQMRSRVCGAQGNTPCVGNSTQRRDCNEIPGESVSSQIIGPFKGSSSAMSFCLEIVLSSPEYPKIHCMFFFKLPLSCFLVSLIREMVRCPQMGTCKLVFFHVESKIRCDVLAIPVEDWRKTLNRAFHV